MSFPNNFFWGAATAAHQVEGDNLNNWTIWEKENAERLAKRSGDNPSDHISGKAANHYSLFKEDLALAKSLNLNAYRFSIEWSRIEPEKGKFNQKEIEHYQKVIAECQVLGIEPFVTMWHWTLPLWFEKEGGWKNPQASKYFLNFANKLLNIFPSVRFWITLNEPTVYANKCFLQGDWPPEEKSLINYFKVLKNLSFAHKKIYKLAKNKNSNLQIGIANHMAYIDGPWPLNSILKYWANNHFLNKINNYQDFIGLNYYFHYKIFGKLNNLKISDMGWELYPAGIYQVLKDLQKFKKPIFITEHGLADANDTNRAWYIEESLNYINKAIDSGINVRGYLHWSLLDNFEWWDGFRPRFGLISVDYKNNFKRVVRPSANIYKKLINKYNSNHN